MPGESTQLLETLAKSTCGSCGITCEPGTQDISLCAARDISEIHINAGDLVDRIEIRYRDGTSAIHGAKGGNKMKPFLFKPGEKLVRISVRQGDSCLPSRSVWPCPRLRVRTRARGMGDGERGGRRCVCLNLSVHT